MRAAQVIVVRNLNRKRNVPKARREKRLPPIEDLQFLREAANVRGRYADRFSALVCVSEREDELCIELSQNPGVDLGDLLAYDT